jgi:hypothetical protein
MTQFTSRSKAAAVALAALAVAGSALAQPKAEGRASVFQSLLDCKAKTDPAERLACFDAATASLGEAEKKGDIVVVDREMAKAARRQAFGFNLPSLDIFSRAEEQPEEADSLTAAVQRAYRGGDGKWVFELEGGAVWAQNDNEGLFREPHGGSRVEIKKAAMGSYFLKLDGQRAIRARRVK